MKVRYRPSLLCLLLIAGVAMAGESPDEPAQKDTPKEPSPAPRASAKEPLPPIAPITDCSEYLKLTPKLTKEEFQQFLERAEKGDPLAMDIVFFSWYSGFGTTADFNQARAWLTRGNKAGAPLCRLYHGRNLLGYWLNKTMLNDEQGKACIQQAESFFLPLAKEGNPAAQFFMGAAREQQKDTNPLDWYEKSAAQGFSSAQVNLAEALFIGKRVERNPQRGLELLKSAAEQDMLLAMVNLSDHLMLLRSSNIDESSRWLRLAAERDYPIACFKLALTHAAKLQERSSQDEAQRLLLKAAESGYPDAIIALADRYLNGTGVQANKKDGMAWRQQAAAIGYGVNWDKPCFKLLSQAERLVRQGKKQEARTAAEESLKAGEPSLGPSNPYLGLLFHKLGHVYLGLGDLEQGEAFHEKAILFFARIGSENGSGMADVLECAAYIDKLRGRFSRAEERLLKALAIFEKLTPGSIHTVRCRGRLADILQIQDRHIESLAVLDDVVRSNQDLSKLDIRTQFEFWNVYTNAHILLHRIPEAEQAARHIVELLPRLRETDARMQINVYRLMGNLHTLKGDYTKAFESFSKAMQACEEIHGQDHFELIHPLLWFGSFATDFGQFDLAEQSLRRALHLCSRQNKSPATTAEVSQALAHLLKQTGRLPEAETLFRSAVKEQSAAETENLTSLTATGSFLLEIGKYQESETLLKKALQKTGKKHDADQTETITPLANLALLCGQLGRFDEEQDLQERRCAIVSKTYGPDHVRTARVYLDLSRIAGRKERYAEALELQQRALTIFQKCYGEPSPKTLEVESILAATHIDSGNCDRAEAILRKLIAASEGLKDYTRLAWTMQLLGLSLHGLQRYEEAEQALQVGLLDVQRFYGNEHLNTALARKNLAFLMATVGRMDEALRRLQEAIRIEECVTSQIGGFSSEVQRVEFAQSTLRTGYALVTLCLEQMSEDPSARSAALDLLLRRQGAVLADVQRERLAAREAGDPALAETMTKRQRLAATLATLTFAGPGNRDPKDYQAQLTDLRKQINELEAEWTRKSTAFREQTRQQQLTATDLRNVLPADAAFIQIAAYRQKNFMEVAESKTWGPRQYAALILTNESEAPVLVKLGAAEPIEKAIAACRAATNKMTRPDQKTAADEWLKAAADVRRLVWDPLAVALKDRRKVYLVPDGELNFVAFGTLPLENGKFLVEEREIALLSNGRDLLRETVASKEGTVLALAAPEFGGIATAQEEVAVARGLFRSHLAGRAGFDRLGAFNPLPGTRAEAKSIEALCREKARKVEVHTGAEATEARLKSAARPAVLHLATHGFFLPEPDDAKKNDSAIRNALLRSGLALAGANRIVKGEAPPADQEDGLVTAEEITGLDLWGTKLVVLSACQTALGESRGGEGVFGLRRAFLLAGAEHLVMSLWSVPDQETQALMVEFYKRYLGGVSAGRALREAQLEYLRRARAENRSTHPFYWGAFVHTGIGVE